jgi:hypothetical protein
MSCDKLFKEIKFVFYAVVHEGVLYILWTGLQSQMPLLNSCNIYCLYDHMLILYNINKRKLRNYDGGNSNK